MITIRLAETRDLEAINEIYNHYVRTSLCTYQEEDETMSDRCTWFEHHGERFPITVAEIDEMVVGWGSLSMFRERSAYRFTVEDSVYVKHDLLGQGIGKALLLDLIERARTLEYKTIIAGCDSLQTASIALHEKLGFKRVAHFRQVGYKFNQWLDLVFLQYMM